MPTCAQAREPKKLLRGKIVNRKRPRDEQNIDANRSFKITIINTLRI